MPSDNAQLFEDSAHYCEGHKVFELFEQLVQQLVIDKPDDPIEFLISELEKPAVPKIMIAGPPASGKGTQCDMIVEKYGVVHLSTGDMLREAVRKKTEVGEKAKIYMDNGELVPDELIVDIVKEKLASADCVKKGWLLDGFPRTKAQAQSLQSAGIIPTKFVLLDVADEIVVDRISGRRVDPETNHVYHLTHNPPPAEVESRCIQRSDDQEDKVRTRLSIYRKNLAGVLGRYKPMMRRIDGTPPKLDVFNAIYGFLSLAPPTRAPRPAPRVILAGPPGAGKKTQCRQLTERFGCVAVSAGELLRTAVLHGTDLGQKVKQYMEDGELVPDTMVNELVMGQLKGEDCKTKGWVLEGYPRNKAQVECLSQYRLFPRHLINLEVKDDEVLDRLLQRRYDPVTGLCYHPKTNWPQAPQVLARLAPHPKDTEKRVQRRLEKWHAYKAEVADNYKGVTRRLNGALAEETVFETLCPFFLQPVD